MWQKMISVIIPVYNAEGFIAETIKSVLNQHYKDFELLLVNDGSKDESGRICKEYEIKDSRIQYYEKENTGVSATRNFGITHAKGDFLVFVDADDTLSPDALQTYINVYESNHADVIIANHSYDYSGKIIKRKSRMLPGIYTYQDLKGSLLDDGTLTGILFGSVCGVFYKREIVIANRILFRPDVKRNEDGLFNIELLKYCSKIQVIDNSLYYYRQWKPTEHMTLERDKELDICDERLLELLEERNELSDYKQQLLRRKVSIAFWNALRVRKAKVTYKISIEYIYELFSNPGVSEGMKYLDMKRMNVYKRALCMLIKHKQAALFYLTVKYIVPLIERMVKR